MRLIAALTVLMAVAFACPARGAEVLQEFIWSKVPQADRSGSIVADGKGAGEVDFLENGKGERWTSTVLIVQYPRITETAYAICGRVRYEGVEGTGCLELWSTFRDGTAYFSRTLGKSGPMACLTGASDWRPFILPFHLKDDGRYPVYLCVNVVLPGKGRVWLSPLRLEQYGKGEDPLAAPGQWWSEQAGGWIGGIGGAASGVLLALLGLLVARGRARRFVTAAAAAMIAVGAFALVLAVVAIALGQPYGVWYPPMLLGALLVVIPGVLLFVARGRYRTLELRRMQALDAR